MILFLACKAPETVTTPATPVPVVDPFAVLPSTSPLTDVHTDLEAVLEHGTLHTACADFDTDPSDENLLRCGKAMFFYESFDGAGVPAGILDFLSNNFPEQVGPGHEAFGLFADPYDTRLRPLGFPDALPMPGGAPTVAFGCAACHFGQLPDGRYAVGMPNTAYDYGAHMLTIGMAPLSIAPGFRPQDHDPKAIADIQPVLDRLQANPLLRIQFGLALLPLVGEEAPEMSVETEGYYADWPPGTMDFVIDPLPLNDDVHIVTRIPPLWEIPEEDAQLAWTGGADTLMDFLVGFIAVTGSPEAWPPERLAPLEAYLYSLRAPVNPEGVRDELGWRVFQDSCLECHSGPRGMGPRLYDFEEIGTDSTLERWGDPELNGAFCCDIGDGEGAPTHQVKSPRLTGLWTQPRLLHNGSVTLEQLLCLQPRPTSEPPYGATGHTYGCEREEADKIALVGFLHSL